MRTAKICILFFIGWLSTLVGAQDFGNTIPRDQFNFGHQVGYMYARMGDAYFLPRGTWRFETGFHTHYSSVMPLVRNNHWKERTFLYVPLYFEVAPSDNISLEIEVTDLFIELPYYDIHSMGGKSPRFKTKIRLLNEGAYVPALAFTAGVKFSSAKPWVIWRKEHNYNESNGLTGAGTGVADYLLLFTVSKKVRRTITLHSHIGLIPVGSPVEYSRGSAQADEIPYGVAWQQQISAHLTATMQWSGMYNGLSSTKLAYYSMARVAASYTAKKVTLISSIQHGLTEESDEWGAGVRVVFEFGRR